MLPSRSFPAVYPPRYRLCTPLLARVEVVVVVVVVVVGASLTLLSSVPFFFEPNFTARVAPLAAALRIQAQSLSNGGEGGEKVDTSAYPPVVYGEFLKSKVAGNFSEEAIAGSGKMGRY
jgi:hypothetical protein